MNQQIVASTIKKWISSCENQEQLAVTHDAVIELFDKRYCAAGTKLSEELHGMCMRMKGRIIEDSQQTDDDSALEEIGTTTNCKVTIYDSIQIPVEKL